MSTTVNLLGDGARFATPVLTAQVNNSTLNVDSVRINDKPVAASISSLRAQSVKNSPASLVIPLSTPKEITWSTISRGANFIYDIGMARFGVTETGQYSLACRIQFQEINHSIGQARYVQLKLCEYVDDISTNGTDMLTAETFRDNVGVTPKYVPSGLCMLGTLELDSSKLYSFSIMCEFPQAGHSNTESDLQVVADVDGKTTFTVTGPF